MSKRERRPCERCCGGREYWCLLKNCEGSVFKSLGYALRTYVARKARLYRANVSVYACLTEFQRQRLVSAGFPEDRMTVIPNMVRPPDRPSDGRGGDYVGFAGRVSPEKGIDVFLSAARRCPQIRFLVAGKIDCAPEILREIPDNCLFLGHLDSGDLAAFYASSRMVVVPSVWYEAFGLCAAEAQSHGKAVICSRIGGLSEVVEEGRTGLLFEAGNADELAEKIQYLWDRPECCRQMGLAGRERALSEYSSVRYYERVMAAYEKAIALGPPGFGGACHSRKEQLQ
jgi:glycosyltransferase involved in cell wall biosynthesis